MSELQVTQLRPASRVKATTGRLFVLELNASRIHSMNPDGSDKRAIVNDCRNCDGIVVDVEPGHIYWTNIGVPYLNDADSNLALWLYSLGIFDKAYAQATARSSDEHADVAPDLFTAETPLGTYQGMTDPVVLSRTPGSFRTVLAPRGSSKPEWLAR